MLNVSRMMRQRSKAVPTRIRVMINRVRRRMKEWWRGENDATFYDIYDLNRVNGLLEAQGVPPLHTGTEQIEKSVLGAMRWILAKLATEPGLRRQFPKALSSGKSSEFAKWIIGYAKDLKLSEQAIQHLNEAFAQEPTHLPLGIWRVRIDLRETFPFGITPHPQREALLHWMVVHGAGDFGLSAEAAIWFFMAMDESSDRGILQSYFVQPEWQEAVPEGATVLGWPKLVKYLKSKYHLAGRWFQRATPTSHYSAWDEVRILRTSTDSVPAPNEAAILRWLAHQPGLAKPTARWTRQLRHNLNTGEHKKNGVNVVAHFSYPSGLQEAAIGLCQGLNSVGWRTTEADLTLPSNLAHWSPASEPGMELFDTSIQVTAVNIFPNEWLPRIGLAARRDVHRIAVWYWELEELPAEWLNSMDWANEVWAPTSFLVNTFRKYLKVPVVGMLPGVELPFFERKSRQYFKLPEDRFLFYFSFDMGSVMQRKNPLAVIAAFRKAFRPDDKVHLVIKVSRGHTDPESLALLERAAAEAGATLINEVFSRSDVLALMDQANCYVSLHRSEGLGLGMAESMLMAKPVIATRYSGNLDFMTDETSYLVDAGRVMIEKEATPTCPYPKGCVWGDPSVDHAAALMRRVYEQQDDALSVGIKAQEDLQNRLSLKAYGQRMANALLKRAKA